MSILQLESTLPHLRSELKECALTLLAALNYSELHLVTVLLFPSFSPPTARHQHLRIPICNSGAAVAAAAAVVVV